MSASTLTVQNVHDMLKQHADITCCPEEDPVTSFLTYLNQVIDRYNKVGRWVGLSEEIELTVTGSELILPSQFSGILKANLIDDCAGIHLPVYGHEEEFSNSYLSYSNSGCLVCQGKKLSSSEVERIYAVYGVDDGKVVKCFVRHGYKPLALATDYVFPDNVGALKMGLLAVQLEDQHDYERSEFYWNKGLQLLDQELEQYLDGQERHINIEPWGRGIPAIENLI